MKKLLGLPVVLIAMLAGYNTYAQKVMNDPSYSIHNYKHPNKAAYARKQQEKQPVVYVEEIKDENERNENAVTASSNYKGMNNTSPKIRKFRVTEAPVVVPAPAPEINRNYKQQFAPTNRKSDNKDKQTETQPVVQN